MSNNLKWYTLQVKSGSEFRVLSAIKNLFGGVGEDEMIEDVFFPCSEKESAESSGKKVSKLMSGYLFIKMDMHKVQLSKILGIPSVSRFLSDGKEPRVITDAEIEKMKNNVSSVSSANVSSAVVERGDEVEVTEGILKAFRCEVVSVDHEEKMVKVSAMILGRSFTAEVEMEKINKVG